MITGVKDDNEEEDNETESLSPMNENFVDLNDPTDNVCENVNSDINQEGDNLELNINHDNSSDDNRRRNSSPSLVKESKINHLPELVRDSNQCESQVESTSQTVRDNNEDIEVRDVVEEENITENDELSTTDIQVNNLIYENFKNETHLNLNISGYPRKFIISQ